MGISCIFSDLNYFQEGRFLIVWIYFMDGEEREIDTVS